MPPSVLRIVSIVLLAASAHLCGAQALPSTAGETLSGRPIVLADAVRGHAAVLVAGFSRQGGNGTGAWIKAIHADSAFANLSVYSIAMLAGAPGFVRGMKKDVSAADQDHFVVLTADEQAWKSFFGVSADNDPYVALIDAHGKILWHAHGPASELGRQLREALP